MPSPDASRRAGSRRHVVSQGALVLLVAACAAVWARLGGPLTARIARDGFDALDPLLVLELATGLAVVGIGTSLSGHGAAGHALARAARAWPARWRARGVRLPTAVLLAAIVSVVAVFRTSLGAANHLPKVLGDELVYTGLAKSWALHGVPLLRGSRDVGHSTLYPLFLAPAFRFAGDGAEALAAARVLNAVAVALTAVPAYLLARRVVSRGWALAVASLSVLVPWTAYAALTMTESLFYPVFVAFAAVLAWTLERPTGTRQAATLTLLAWLVGIRAQALTLALATVVAVPCHGLLEGRTRDAVRRFAPTFAVFGAALVIGVAASLGGVAVPTSSYNVVFGSLSRLGAMFEWGAWSIASYGLAVGVVALVALPVALGAMLRATRPAAARSTAVVTLTTALALLGSVALLSASPYGLHVLHERSLFFVTPLVLTCLAHWLSHGLVRPRRTAVASALALVGLAAVLSPHVALRSNVVDLPSAAFFDRLGEQVDISFRVWAVGLTAAGAATFLLVRRALFPVVSVVLAFAAVTARTDYRDDLTRAQARSLAWVDHALPPGAEATLVYVDLVASAPCASVTATEQQDFTVWTEFSNTRIDAVRHVYATNPRDFLASRPLGVGKGGLILSGETPFSPPYAVLDSRQPIVGQMLARLDLATIHSVYQAGASLTLWRVEPPLRFLPRPQPLPPRGDGGQC